jgi:hypothetical protein
VSWGHINLHGIAGLNVAAHRPARGRVIVVIGIPVHCGAIEWGQVTVGDHIGREHAFGCGSERDSFGPLDRQDTFSGAIDRSIQVNECGHHTNLTVSILLILLRGQSQRHARLSGVKNLAQIGLAHATASAASKVLVYVFERGVLTLV